MYNYYQQNGGEEVWKPVPTANLSSVTDAMFVTILSVDSPVHDGMTKEELVSVKYKGDLYFDLDDAASPASTAKHTQDLVKRLEVLGIFPDQLAIYASGGKGFHILVPAECFFLKMPKTGIALLPAIYKEMAFELAVPSLDLRVYTARKGRMFRQANVKRPNGLYKVRINHSELEGLTEDKYKEICSEPRKDLDIDQAPAELAYGALELFDRCRAKVSKAQSKKKQAKPVVLPKDLPSFDLLLRGEGIREGSGFHQLAMQIAITAHARGMSEPDLLAAAAPLLELHAGDGLRYNTFAKRKQELSRMFSYTDDNPCYEFNSAAIRSLLNHNAPDLSGLIVSEAEVKSNIAAGQTAEGEDNGVDANEFDYGNVIMTQSGMFCMTEAGPKQISAVSFDNVLELVSAETGNVAAMEVDVYVAGVKKARQALDIGDFTSASSLNDIAMRHGQVFLGSDNHGKGAYLKSVEKARKNKSKMYIVAREGLDFLKLAHHEDEEVRNGFMIWADTVGVVTEPRIADKNISFKFLGHPEPRGYFRTDINDAPDLIPWLKEGNNKETLQTFMKHLLSCQKPAVVGRLLGWMVACHYRMLFHKKYDKFPLLHLAGAAGQGKTEMTKLFASFHYYQAEPKMLTPSSTVFSVGLTASGSSSIPLVLDEFKPSAMAQAQYDKFTLILRDAYNCRAVERGGGNRDSTDFKALHSSALSSPMCFIAEAVEEESALMERVVFTMLIKPPAVQLERFRVHFDAAKVNHQLLGMLGKYMAAQIINRYSLEKLGEEFEPMWADAREELMMAGASIEKMSESDIRKRSGAKDRTVYNYTVAKFGLRKFRNLIKGIFEEEFEALFQAMEDTIYDSMVELQDTTIAEWLKVFNVFGDMAALDPGSTFFLREGKDYAHTVYNGKECLELYSRACYFKYRAYCMSTGTKPLFHGEQAFVHGISAVTAILASNTSVELDCPGGSHLFDAVELNRAGFRGLGK